MPPLVVDNLDALKDFVGREIAITDWFLVTQDRIQQFAEATEDRQWIHLDRERARRESPYHTTIAHGFLTLSLLSHLAEQALQIQHGVRMAVNYGLNRVRFPAPVRAGLENSRALHIAISDESEVTRVRSRLFQWWSKMRARESLAAWRSGLCVITRIRCGRVNEVVALQSSW